MDINDYIDTRDIDEIEKEYYLKFIYPNHQNTDCLTVSHSLFGFTSKNLQRIQKIISQLNFYKVLNFLVLEPDSSELSFLAKTINNAKKNKELILFYNQKIYFINNNDFIKYIKNTII
jgi:hypothetical protein